MDYEYPDIPIGGWAGVVKEIDNESPPNRLISWNEQTLEGIHPIYKNRCERDGLYFELMNVPEDDLEPYDGGAIEIEQPTKIVTKPLNLKDEEDRIELVFELTSDDFCRMWILIPLGIYRDHPGKASHLPL